MNIDLELYKIFYTAAFHSNVSQAAKALYITQPAVSKSIKKLEEKVGVPLFIRNSRGIRLTEEGRVLYEHIGRAMTEIIAGESVLEKLRKKEQGVIRLGVSTTLCRYFLIPYLQQFIRLYPNIEVHVVNKTTHDTVEMFKKGEIDFGIISQPFAEDTYNFIKLKEIQDTFVAQKAYMDSFKTVSNHAVLSNCPLMLLEGNNITRQYVERYLAENKITVQTEITIGSMDFLIEFAKIGLGVAAVIREFVEKELQEGLLVEIPLEFLPEKRAIGVITHKHGPVSIASRTFISYLVQCHSNK